MRESNVMVGFTSCVMIYMFITVFGGQQIVGPLPTAKCEAIRAKERN